MAAKAIRSPLILQASRGFSAQAAPAVKKEVSVQSAVLPNKTFIAAVDNGSPLTRVTVAFKAGSRYEPVNELGISHVLRSSAGLTTNNASSYIIARQLQQIGASITASGDREFIYYTLETSQYNLQEAVKNLVDLISNQEFRPWELSDNEPRLKFDIVSLPPQVRAVDLLHKAAYRRGLGNSLFISPKKIGKISTESLQHFSQNNLAFDKCSVTVIGSNLDGAKLIAQQLQLGSGGSASQDVSKYFGGDMRKEMGGDLAHVAFGLQGAAAGSPQSLALAVAAKALGNGPVTKWGSINSVLTKAVGNIGPFAAAGFNVTYSDSGLFGVILSVPKDEAATAAKAVARVLKSPKLTDKEITAAKNQLKMEILSEAEDSASLAEALAAQGLYFGDVKTPITLAAAIDKVQSSDVSSALSAAAQTKLSCGAAGNLSNLPYSDEL